MRLSAVFAGLSAAACVLAGCGGSGGAAGDGLGNGLATRSSGADGSGRTGRIAVVAGENPWGDILAQIGGSAVSVTSIIDQPDEDPHQYESTLSDAAAVGHAKLVVANGGGYDDFLNRLLGADHPSGRAVLDVAKLVRLSGANPNPHLWYQPRYVVTAAREFAHQLSVIAPAEARTFAANLRTFLAGEQLVVDVIDQIRSRHGGAEVGYTERVPGYLVDAAGLTLATPSGFAQALEDGNDPNPIDNARFEDAISSHRMKVLLYNAQVTDQLTRTLKKYATSHGVSVVGVTETLPAGEKNFQTWQLDQARALLAALGG